MGKDRQSIFNIQTSAKNINLISIFEHTSFTLGCSLNNTPYICNPTKVHNCQTGLYRRYFSVKNTLQTRRRRTIRHLSRQKVAGKGSFFLLYQLLFSKDFKQEPNVCVFNRNHKWKQKIPYANATYVLLMMTCPGGKNFYSLSGPASGSAFLR